MYSVGTARYFLSTNQYWTRGHGKYDKCILSIRHICLCVGGFKSDVIDYVE